MLHINTSICAARGLNRLEAGVHAPLSSSSLWAVNDSVREAAARYRRAHRREVVGTTAVLALSHSSSATTAAAAATTTRRAVMCTATMPELETKCVEWFAWVEAHKELLA